MVRNQEGIFEQPSAAIEGFWLFDANLLASFAQEQIAKSSAIGHF